MTADERSASDYCAVRAEQDALRERQHINEAIRARQFTAEQTLEMGFDLINFALRFNKEVRFEPGSR